MENNRFLSSKRFQSDRHHRRPHHLNSHCHNLLQVLLHNFQIKCQQYEIDFDFQIVLISSSFELLSQHERKLCIEHDFDSGSHSVHNICDHDGVLERRHEELHGGIGSEPSERVLSLRSSRGVQWSCSGLRQLHRIRRRVDAGGGG